MINFRIIARVFSRLLIFEGLFMLAAAVVSWLYHEPSAASIVYSALITIVTGVIVFTPLRNEDRIFGNKEGYIIVTGAWLVISLFSTLPFLLSGSIDRFGDAFFESVSGFTTTGASIIADIESLPHGILLWRSLTQWLGGIGIIAVSLPFLPVIKSVNIQLTSTEFTGQLADKIHPRINDAIKRFIFIYCMITLAEVVLLMLGGMPVFDAICHSFSTLSTGGFSTRNEGIAAFNSPYIKIILTMFMFIAGTNMTIIYFGLKRNFKKITGNNEFKFYTFFCLIFIIIGSIILYFKEDYAIGNSVLEGAFQVVSFITTTGFYTYDYNLWNDLFIIVLFILMFTGGMSGSTSGSIKITRILLLAKNNRQEFKRLIHPSAFVPVRIDKHLVPPVIIYNILVFISIYFILVCFGAFVISIMDYDLITSFSTSAAMLGNIGPGISTFGPFTDYASMPMAGKWFLAALMILGRLEILTVMILFTRNFYKH
jgi:trk system potassium uptake protein